MLPDYLVSYDELLRHFRYLLKSTHKLTPEYVKAKRALSLIDNHSNCHRYKGLCVVCRKASYTHVETNRCCKCEEAEKA